MMVLKVYITSCYADNHIVGLQCSRDDSDCVASTLDVCNFILEEFRIIVILYMMIQHYH